MKIILFLLIYLVSFFTHSQDANLTVNNAPCKDIKSTSVKTIDNNGFSFKMCNTIQANSKYSEFSSTFFKDKLIMVSSNKLGALGKIDSNTNEGYKELYCLDIIENGDLTKPLLFSRFLNTSNSECQITFAPNEETVYYTRSKRKNSLEYKLYKAQMKKNSHGNWIKHELLEINNKNISIETPFMNNEGDKLYFAANNMYDSYGGYDIYVSDVYPDGTLSSPKNLGSDVNTASDEKYPSLSKDSKFLYFSSNGHESVGGFDIFESRILSTGYKAPRNLGNTINSSYDEVALIFATENQGYVSTNKPMEGKGGFDIYAFTVKKTNQILQGKVIDLVTEAILPNTLLILLDEDGTEVDRQITDENGKYNFNVVPFENYTITSSKTGFSNDYFKFSSTKTHKTTHNKDLKLITSIPLTANMYDPSKIVFDVIQFDFNKYSIKKESHSSLNKMVRVLKKNKEINIDLNAHTDNIGKENYNLKLSDKRAASILKYLMAKGIPKERLQPKSYGESKPLINCNENCSKEELQTNRRVELLILKE